MDAHIKKEIKHRISAILVTTALAVMGLSAVAVFYQGAYLCIDTIFQIFFVNIIIHVGLWLFERMECSYIYLEILSELGIVLAVLLSAGYAYKWFDTISAPVLGILGAVVYGAACLTETIQIQNNLKKINEMLKKQERS